MEAIIAYWNLLQAGTPETLRLAIWGDLLLPPPEIARGLIAHNWDGRAKEYLRQLDRRIEIINWQYGTIDPISAQLFLSQAGHSTGLASGQYSPLNPFLHAKLCREGGVTEAIHTTWASPHPRDCPLESVTAAALAHAGGDFDSSRTPAECSAWAGKIARWLMQQE